jgi:DNA-binding MarR family transcriptional regulator
MLSIGSDARVSDDFLEFMRTVGSLHRSLSAVGEAVAATAGLSHARVQCLQQLVDGPLTVAEVAARLEVARQGVLRLADLLVADGLATYADNPRHRRAKLLTLTGPGRLVLAELAAVHHGWVERTAAELAPLGLPELTERLRATQAVLRGAPGPSPATPASRPAP